MKRYKQAKKVIAQFYKNTRTSLQEILRKRKSWGDFEPGEIPKIKSTQYGGDYPYINAQIEGKIHGEKVKIEIAVDWYESDSDYPFYCIRFYENNKYDDKISSYEEHGKVKRYRNMYGSEMLIYVPDPNDFSLDRDLNLLIDEFIKTVSR
jgi:hypothetical protein